MDVMTYRFIVICTIIVVGLLVIPIGVLLFWMNKYDNKGRWWMLPVTIIYVVIFFYYTKDLMPEKWTLKPVEVYQCEWKTQYIPKYPITKDQG